MGGASLLVNFADVAERINPAVVNIDAASRGRSRPRAETSRSAAMGPTSTSARGREGDPPRKGAGTGFIIDADGHILTNHHVIDRADRITVRLTDGRSLRARVIGSDPDTDIALIKVDSAAPLAVAPLGDSDTLRVGEWVCAIGNPLAYEHTVTVGVVSYVGRKLFDTSLDNYIQTDAAINFGNSGGPLINGRGEVIGINAAISSRASNIGFAVPVNQAVAILPQLKEHGRVSRGFIGVFLMDVDPDLQRSLRLPAAMAPSCRTCAADRPATARGCAPTTSSSAPTACRCRPRRAHPPRVGAGAGHRRAPRRAARRAAGERGREAGRAAGPARDAGAGSARRAPGALVVGARRRHRPDGHRHRPAAPAAARPAGRPARRAREPRRADEPGLRRRHRARVRGARDQPPAGAARWPTTGASPRRRAPATCSRSTSTCPRSSSAPCAPCGSTAREAAGHAAAHRIEPTMKPRILVIDDEPAIRESLRMILEYEGYDCVLAATGQEGWRSSSASRRTWCSSTSRCPGWTGSRCCSASGRRTTRCRS
jgi:S1-C subfamily serine protease